jgi:hypothetical protein
MSEETTQTQSDGTDVSMILCRVIDVNSAIQNSFTRFLDSENKTLDDLAMLLRDEMSKIELFAPNLTTDQQG